MTLSSLPISRKSFATIFSCFFLHISVASTVAEQRPVSSLNNRHFGELSKPSGLVIEPDDDARPSPIFNATSYGMVADGTTDNASALSTMLSDITVGANGGRITFPCGIYRFSTSLSLTIPSGKNLTIEGENCTKLLFGSTDGLVLAYTDNSSWVVVRNIELATSSTAGANTAIWLKSPTVNIPQNARSTVIEHVHINGSDRLGGANYWGEGIFQDKVSFLNINDLTCNGSFTLQGDCVLAQGDASTPEFNVVTNIINSNFSFCQTGFKYGTYYQGLTFVGGNITGCNRGIYAPVGNSMNLQASVSSSQFNNGTSNVEFASEMAGVQITGNTFLLHNYGIKTAGLVNSSIIGNSFLAAVLAGQGHAITIGTSGNTAESVAITGNTCLSINSCINIASGAKGIAANNVWWNVTAPFTNLSSTFFQANNIQNGARQVTQAGPLSAVSYSDTVTVNNLLGSKTSPTIGSGFCTSPSILVPNGTFSFRVAVGLACDTSSGTVAMPTSANGWSCTVTSVANVATSNPAVDLSASSASSIVIKNYSRTTGTLTNFTSSDSLLVNCLGQ